MITDFASMQEHHMLAWARETWKQLRERSFIMSRMGTTADSGIQKITELTSLPSGNKAIINLLHDLIGDGVVGDQTLKGREEEAKMSQADIVVDQMRHGVANKGRMSDQKGVLKIRNEAKDLLAYGAADRIDQLAFLTMAGVTYDFRTDGADRGHTKWLDLEFAPYVKPPSANRHVRWQESDKTLQPGDTAAVVDTDVLSYRALVELKAHAHDLYIRPMRWDGGLEYYEIYLHPHALKALKLDPDFHDALKLAMPRTPDNPIFKDAEVYFVDGMALYPYRHSFNNRRATVQWGSGGDVLGNRITLMGAQALAYAELGAPMWDEELDDYNARWGVAIAQILGFMKPQFPDIRLPGSPKEDFGMISLDVAMKI